MTYNQIRNRLRRICADHKQVRTVKFGKYGDHEDGEVKYAAVFIQDTQGTLSPASNAATFGFRLFVLDQTHLSEDAEMNEQDVLSDCFSIAQDLVTQLAFSGFTDWRLSGTNSSQPVVDYGSDFTAGCYVDFSVSTIYRQNLCAVPSDYIITEETTHNMQKLVYDETYIATGTEGITFEVPAAVIGKKILLVVRENGVMFKTSVNPGSTEYTWDGRYITYGTTIQPEERTLFLFREY